MLKFSMETFYPPLFSHCFPFSNFPAILFPSVILLPSKTFPHQKSKAQKTSKAEAQNKNQRQKAKSPRQKAEAPSPPSVGSKQGGEEALREGRDIVTGETCFSEHKLRRCSS
jgi:hypothetical protein